MEISSSDVEKGKISELVDDLFKRTGFEQKDEISVDEFTGMLKEYSSELGQTSISLEG